MASGLVRFGVFTFDPAKLELQKSGYPQKLPQQSALLLAMLLEKPGEIVTRDQMRDRIWPEGTHVEFDFSLNTAINRIRRILDDSARNPRYLETVHRTGYRFIAACEVSPTPAAAPPPLLKPNPRLYLAAALAAVFIAGGVWWALGGQLWVNRLLALRPTAASLRSTVLLPMGHFPNAVRIAPNGEQIAYLAGNKLYLRRLDRNESIPVEGSDSLSMFEYSPDSSAIAIFKHDGIYIQSGNQCKQTVKFKQIAEVRSAAWARDGMLYFSDDQGNRDLPSIYRAPATGGVPERVLEGRSILGRIEFPMIQQILSGDGAMLFSRALSPLNRTIHARSSRGVESNLIKPGMGGRSLPTGHLLYYWAHSLFAVPWDANRLELVGSPVKVVDGVRPEGWHSGAADVSTSGTLVYLPQPPPDQREILMVDENGVRSKTGIPTGEYEQVRVSPDQKRLAVVRKDGGSNWSVWVYEFKTKLWRSCAEVSLPSPRVVWSPDGEWLALGLIQGDSEFVNLHRLKVSDPSQIQRLSEQANYGQFPNDWVAKTNTILFTEGVHLATKSDLNQVSADGGPTKSLVQTEGWDLDAQVSPDGNWLAYASETTEGTHTYIRPYNAPGAPIKVTPTPGRFPVFSKKGDKLWIKPTDRDGLLEISLNNGKPTGAMAKKYQGIHLFHPDLWTRSHDITPDGKLYTILPGPRDSRGRIEIISNWFNELDRQAPSRR